MEAGFISLKFSHCYCTWYYFYHGLVTTKFVQGINRFYVQLVCLLYFFLRVSSSLQVIISGGKGGSQFTMQDGECRFENIEHFIVSTLSFSKKIIFFCPPKCGVNYFSSF